MSPVEKFEYLARRLSAQEVVAFLLSLDKKDVLAVRQKVKELYGTANDWTLNTSHTAGGGLSILFLAGLATYSRKEAMGRSFEIPWNFHYDNEKHQHGHKELFMTVLRHSRPDWLADWLLRGNSWQIVDYSVLRDLLDADLIPHEPRLFAQALADRLNRLNRTRQGHAKGYDTHVLRQLQTDPELLRRDLPLLFDFDTTADSALIYGGKSGVEISWLTLLPQLAASGHLDRADLLSRSLLALRRDFRRPLLTWFRNLWLALQPTPAERLARQTELTELLAHPLPLVVNFALDQLKDLWAAPDFQPDTLLLYADGLMSRPDLKTGLKTLLAGLAKISKAQPEQAPALARLYAAALTHPDGELQTRAAKALAALLSAKQPRLDAAQTADLTTTIAGYADLLAPGARTALAPWLAAPGSIVAGGATDADTTPSNGNLKTYAPNHDFRPDISPATVIAPVADWHELLFLTGQVLKFDDPAILERWLDGLLRLRPQFPADHAKQLRPYLRAVAGWAFESNTEAETRRALLAHSFGETYNGLPQLVQALLFGWFTGFVQPKVGRVNLTDHDYSNPDPLLGVVQRRLATVEARLAAPAATAAPAPALPLLSTPSHAPHWVAPSVLVDKLLGYEAAAQLPDPTDLAVALARTAFGSETDAAAARLALTRLQAEPLRELLTWFLAPVSSSEAAAVAPLPLPTAAGGTLVGRVLTELLGKLTALAAPAAAPAAPAAPALLADALPWLWAVAARTRHPDAGFEQLRPLADYPGLAEAWQPGWHLESKSNLIKQSWNKARPEYTHTWQELIVPTDHQGQRPPSPLLLYSLHARLSQKKPYYLWSMGGSLPFLLALLPNNPAPLHWHLLRTAARTDDLGAEGRNAVEHLLTSLLVPGPPFADAATTLLAVGLTHYAPACRALALAVLLSAIEQGRLVPAALGEALGRLLGAGFAPVPRLSGQLTQARAISPRTDDALRQTLDALLPALPGPAPVRNTRQLLDAYADLHGRHPQPVPAAVRTRLREWQAVPSLKKSAATLLI